MVSWVVARIEEDQEAAGFVRVYYEERRPVNWRKRVVKPLILVGLVLILALILVARNAIIVHNGYELMKVQGEVTQAEKDMDMLRIDVAALKSPERVRRIAVKDLGMVVPPQVWFAAGNDNQVPVRDLRRGK